LVVAAALALWWWKSGQPDAGKYGVDVTHFTVSSKTVGDRDEVGLVSEKSSSHPPLLVLLHGRGMSPEGFVSDELLAALKSEGRKAPAVALLDGGESSYWHDRADGNWGSYVVDEAIPRAAAELNADLDRVAIGGVSMGGFGALDLARLNPDRFCAVGGHSAALWRDGGQTPAGAFDDAEDFERHDIFQAVDEGFRYGIPLWIDVGLDDPFFVADGDLGRMLQENDDVSLHFWPGAHNTAYWWSHMDQYIRFYTDALAACDRLGSPGG
jgi:S-formylglutathione hydrolase FrmB